MDKFRENLIRFPSFLISVLLGFYLTTFNPIFRLLKFNATTFSFVVLILAITFIINNILKLMLGLN